VAEGKATVHLVSGAWGEHAGPIQSPTDIHMTFIDLVAGARIHAPVAPGRNVFLYVVRGDITVGGEDAIAFRLVELNNDGDAVDMGRLRSPVSGFLVCGLRSSVNMSPEVPETGQGRPETDDRRRSTRDHVECPGYCDAPRVDRGARVESEASRRDSFNRLRRKIWEVLDAPQTSPV
jgi:hypothetical protein